VLSVKQLRRRRAFAILAFVAVLLKRIEKAPLFLFVVGLFLVRLSVAGAQGFAVAGILPQHPGQLDAARGTLDSLDASQPSAKGFDLA
jgi:uncharacterized membrane protein YjjB (DUF3815 family)